jgi:hypothetical protein
MSPARSNTRRAVLIHWKAAEGEALLPAIRDAGWESECLTPDGSVGLQGLRDNPPQVIVIDLSRLPSHGRDVGIAFRRYKSTRNVPLVFVGGASDKVDALKSVLPDALYAEWPTIGDALSAALRQVPDAPVVPPALEGYSGTPLWKKLGISDGSIIAIFNAPQGFRAKLTPPFEIRIRKRSVPADRVLLFVRDSKQLDRCFDRAAKSLRGTSGLWLIWPKKSSGIHTDVTETTLRAFGMEHGWVDYKVCAVDDTWSGLQFARKRG